MKKDNYFEYFYNKKIIYNDITYYCKMRNHKGEILLEKSMSIPESFWGNFWVNESFL